MVEWYAPLQLLRTGVAVAVSAALGQRLDYRLMEDRGPPPRPIDYSHGGQQAELWFDYLADTGDGWNSTYAIASLVAQPFLEVEGGELPHGEFLVLGGDEVYPVASQRNYRERFVAPFETALPKGAGARDLWAIPGNHDWYDGLVSFARRFTQGRPIGDWQTRQVRSYFALRLPQRWWLWAVDVQLEADIDIAQRDYFRAVGEDLQRGDRVILVSAQPDWLYRDSATEAEAVEESNLAYLEERIIKQRGATVHLWLAGDLHHYRRHEKRHDPRFQRITSGGGGAYLSATHGPLFGASTSVSRPLVRVGEDEFEPKCAFPTPATSFRLSLLNLLFLVRNWKVGILTGIAYACFTWGYAGQPLATLLLEPARLAIIIAVLAGFVFYADRERPAFRILGGLAHGTAHLAAALAVAAWTQGWLAGGEVERQAARILANFVVGAMVGPIVWGFYLLIAHDVFGAQANEAFSALRIEDHKHFLRLHVGRDGVLTVYPIGVPRVPRRGEAIARYLLIEDPVRIDPGPAPRTG
jgi:hypothetical protein